MESTLIIAEAGVNHNGSLDNAKKLVECASKAGADYVKFQTFKAEKLVTKHAKKAEYQIQNLKDADDSQFKMLKSLEMPFEWHYELKRIAESFGIKFLSTGFDEESIDFLDELGVDLFKIPSGEITNKPFLTHIAKKNKPVIISTGMSNMIEISQAIDVLTLNGINREKIIVLHCNTEYPTPMIDVNLKAMLSIAKDLKVEVGYSDHTVGIEVPIAAVALGAKVVEKHFTLDNKLLGPDHLASLNPLELKAMVVSIRNIEKAILGNGIKIPSESELKNKLLIRKSLHFSRKLCKGHKITLNDFICLRPGFGISPMEIDEYIGKTLDIDVDVYEIAKSEYFKI